MSVSTHVPAGVSAFHDAIASWNRSGVSITGLVAWPTRKLAPL